MANYSFLHNPDLLANFDEDDFSANIAQMHDQVALHETKILDIIQLTFDWTRSWDAKPRYKIAEAYPYLYEKTWSLYNIDSNWNKDTIRKGAEFLSQHLDYLPVYIIDAAYTIMGECLGYKASVNQKFYMPKSNEEYKEFIELGKSHLAILMALIKELGKLGIDCRAIKINTRPYYVGSRIASCFNSKSGFYEVRKNFDVEEYHGYISDSNFRTISKEKAFESDFAHDTDAVYRLLTFNNLEEFLEYILKNVERICAFTNEMINPEAIDFSNYYYPNEALPNSFNLPTGELVDFEEYVKSFLAKLKKGEFIAEYYKSKQLEERKEDTRIEPYKDEKDKAQERKTTDQDLLKEIIKYLLSKNYIPTKEGNSLVAVKDLENKLPIIATEFCREESTNGKHYSEEEVKIIIKMLINVIQVNVEVFVNNAAPTENKDKLIEDLVTRIQSLEERQATLEEKVNNIEADISAIKKQIITYLETGNNMPNIQGLDRQQVIKIIQDYNSKAIKVRLRKLLLLGSIALGLSALLTSSNQNVNLPNTTHIVSETTHKRVIDQSHSIGDYFIPGVPNVGIKESEVQKPSFNMHMFEENEGMRNYYTSIYDKERKGMTEQSGIVIRYFALQDNRLIQSFATEEELQDFIKNNDPMEFTWKSAISCIDYQALADFIEQGIEIPLQYTTFFTDYIPLQNLSRERRTDYSTN